METNDNLTRAERLQLASQQRREREKKELRQAILDAAGALFLEHGYEAFSLRQVAEAIGYSPGTIYLHFNDKDDLLFSVADEGFLKFGQAIGAAAAGTDDPRQRLIDMGRAYLNFGLNNPQHYQLMFVHRPDYLLDRPDEDFQPRINSFQILQIAVEQAIEAGLFGPADSLAIADAIWAQFHGIVSLAIGMPGFFTAERAHQATEKIFTMMFEGLKP